MPQSSPPYPIRIVDFPETPVAVMTHRGDPALIAETVGRFIAWRKANHLPPSQHATFNILYGGPDQVPPAEFRQDLCVATGGKAVAFGSGVAAGIIAGGRCAVLRHVGPDDGLEAALTYLYGDWLSQSGEELRDSLPFLQRFPELAGHDSPVDIFLPLR
ncbi:Bacterial transcription activator effector binding protein [Paramagnetospirillum magnetotacticum MS-1]|uniref:Bacterial transcription activator effector binding protein n=1 Tax=Paramagnetospirillum magnetotacticum MS-1 TaxID=272627 RepID=A0A0C2UZU3_PARME